MEDSKRQELVAMALSVRNQAYAPYSKFRVGAAVLTEDGTLFSGSNVENASYGLSICAERVAAAAAIAAGHRKLLAVAVASTGGAFPCGACRQFLAEFGGCMDVLLVDVDQPENVQTLSLADLLPVPFHLSEQ